MAALSNGPDERGLTKTEPNNPSARHLATNDQARCPLAFVPKQWFLLRAAYGQERKAQQILNNFGFETYLPLTVKEYINGTHRNRRWMSLLPNLLFVHTTASQIKPYLGGPLTPFLHHYYVPHVDNHGRPLGYDGKQPLVIPEQQMQNFILWNEVQEKNKILLLDEKVNFKNGDFVRVAAGQFEGFMGHVIRLRGQQRVGINIKGVGAVFTAYVPTAWIEKIK